jgi:hypothetical protein
LEWIKEKDAEIQKITEQKKLELNFKDFLLERIRERKDSEIKEKDQLILRLKEEKHYEKLATVRIETRPAIEKY